jgi:hypothetical protein
MTKFEGKRKLIFSLFKTWKFYMGKAVNMRALKFRILYLNLKQFYAFSNTQLFNATAIKQQF